MIGVNMVFLYYYIRTDSGHVFIGPSKVVVTLLEELNECKVKFGAETCTNLDLVIWESGMNANIIKLVYA